MADLITWWAFQHWEGCRCGVLGLLLWWSIVPVAAWLLPLRRCFTTAAPHRCSYGIPFLCWWKLVLSVTPHVNYPLGEEDGTVYFWSFLDKRKNYIKKSLYNLQICLNWSTAILETTVAIRCVYWPRYCWNTSHGVTISCGKIIWRPGVVKPTDARRPGVVKPVDVIQM